MHIGAPAVASVASSCSFDSSSDDDITLYRIAGFAIQSCIKVCKITTNAIKQSKQIQVRNKLGKLANEITVLESFICKDKTKVPEELRLLDRGGLIFPISTLLPFLRTYSKAIKSYLNHYKFEDIGDKVVKVHT